MDPVLCHQYSEVKAEFVRVDSNGCMAVVQRAQFGGGSDRKFLLDIPVSTGTMVILTLPYPFY